MNDCARLDESGWLQMYVDGEIDEWGYAIVAVHVARCNVCQNEVRAFVTLKRALRRQQVVDPEAVARLCSFAALLTRGCR
jgi:anti-sigma factor RsiW